VGAKVETVVEFMEEILTYLGRNVIPKRNECPRTRESFVKREVVLKPQ
jgi:hypothetical protein